MQQLVWSPDGQWFVGTANGLGPFWNVGRVSAQAGAISAVSETSRYNCTPDWMLDSQHVVYARGIVPEEGGWAELWLAGSDGQQPQLLYAEEHRHIYGGCASPDGNYFLFTRSDIDLGQVDNSNTRLAIIRRADTPMIGGEDPSRPAHDPRVRRGPVLDLSSGWEPHWTYAEPASARVDR